MIMLVYKMVAGGLLCFMTGLLLVTLCWRYRQCYINFVNDHPQDSLPYDMLTLLFDSHTVFNNTSLFTILHVLWCWLFYTIIIMAWPLSIFVITLLAIALSQRKKKRKQREFKNKIKSK